MIALDSLTTNPDCAFVDEDGKVSQYLAGRITIDSKSSVSYFGNNSIVIGAKPLGDVFLLPEKYLQNYLFEKVWTLLHEISHGIVHFLTAEKTPTYNQSFNDLQQYAKTIRTRDPSLGLAKIATKLIGFYENTGQSHIEDLTELTALYLFEPEYLKEHLNDIYPGLDRQSLVNNRSQGDWVDGIYNTISQAVEGLINKKNFDH